MFKKIKDKLKDKTREKLFTHLVNLGLDAEIVENGTPEDVGNPSIFTPFKQLPLLPHSLQGHASDMGSIKIIGKEINVIQITRYRHVGQYSSGTTYEIDYAVKADVKRKEESVKARTKIKRSGLSRKQRIDLKWTGGKIAELLNADKSLKKRMLEEQMLTHFDVEIKPDNKKPYIRIHQYHGEFPSEKAFECYNTIARHIRQLLQ